MNPASAPSTSGSYSIRAARPGDEHALFELVKQLAVYEQLEHAVQGSAEKLGADLFGERPHAEALVAEASTGLLGFALFFSSYSTFLTRPGIYLEDLFVLESERKKGIGRALLSAVRALADARGAGRLEWAVLDWNESAIRFYRDFGADILPDWRVCRVALRAKLP